MKQSDDEFRKSNNALLYFFDTVGGRHALQVFKFIMRDENNFESALVFLGTPNGQRQLTESFKYLTEHKYLIRTVVNLGSRNVMYSVSLVNGKRLAKIVNSLVKESKKSKVQKTEYMKEKKDREDAGLD